uniref:NADH dehydrogenase (Ubiquinone) complex I, assembly factor 6 n=1 Tax=Clastoptera arizonana TaxID=38151 RepID=A0A1B6CD17_9HEMI
MFNRIQSSKSFQLFNEIFGKSVGINCRYVSKKSALVTPPNYCLNLLRTHDYENFLCSLLLPNILRRSAFAIRAFNIEISKVQERVSDPKLGQMRFQFWQDTLEKLYKEIIPQHPVALELFTAIKNHKLKKRHLQQLITSRTEHLLSPKYKSLEDVEKYSEQSVSSIYYLLLQSAGIENIHADHAASHLGKAQGISNLIRSIPHNLQRRLLIFPQDILLKHNISQESILRAKNDKPIRDAVFEIASRANQHLEKV